MWSPFDEDGPGTWYARNEIIDGKGIQWDVCGSVKKAALFKSSDIAKRIAKNIPFLKEKWAQGWVYEVVKVSEEVLDTNIPAKKETAA
jgi:hypothetical protein